MKLLYSTGNKIVDQVSQIHFTGNIIPITWYKTIVNDTGKPYWVAINILSDIVYWYRAKEVRNEETGRLVKYEKRFAADLLQRNYRQICEEFGITKKQARSALEYLEDIGVIKRHLRNEKSASGVNLSNVMYLELIPEILIRLTYPRGEEVLEEKEDPPETEMAEGSYLEGTTLVTSRVPGSNQEDTSLVPLKTQGSNPEGTTNTETTTEIKDMIDEMDRTRRIVKEKIEYEYIVADHSFDKESLDEIVELITDIIAVPRGTVIIGGAAYSYGMVKEQFLKLEAEHIRYVLESLKSTTTRIRNIRSYLLTALYNAPNTIGNHYRAEVNHDMNIPKGWPDESIDSSFLGLKRNW